MRRFSGAHFDWFSAAGQMVLVMVIWTFLSLIISIKAGLASPVTYRGVFSVADHLAGWGVCLLILPLIVYVVRKGVLEGHWIISLLLAVLLAAALSFGWTEIMANELELPAGKLKELKLPDAESYLWQNKEAHFVQNNTYDLFFNLLLIIGISFATSTYQLLRLRERSEVKLKERLYRLNVDLLNERLEKSKSTSEFRNQPNSSQKIPIKLGSKTYFLEYNQVAYIRASGNYLELFDLDNKHIIRETMTSIMAKLPDHFVRIHKSSIVNTSFIDELISIGYGDFELKMKDGKQMRISDSYKQQVLKRLEF